MSLYDYLIFIFYMLAVLSVGIYYFFRNKNREDYYVGSRKMKAGHVGLSIAATDVGGGFTIGLGGVGFLMGLSGSWLLFTGLVGAWLFSVLIIPQIKKIDKKHNMMTYPDFLRHHYGGKVALIAAIISGLGYMGFTGAQMLAGAKLASVTIFSQNPFQIDAMLFSIVIIAIITILYTVFGGLKAVMYTDTVQWLTLITGLLFIAIPFSLYKIGGFHGLLNNLPSEFFTLTNINFNEVFNWMVTFVPIWFVGMTLYQRVFACKNEKEAKKAWYIAGLFEYPVMAFTGVFLGMCARALYPGAEAEMAMPMLIRDVLPVGITGVVIASYFSAIMSTADSCLIASSGNFVNDIIERYFIKNLTAKKSVILSMAGTLLIGAFSVIIALQFKTVLNAILYVYSFMVSGLFIPTIGAYFWDKKSTYGAAAGMISGGSLTLLLQLGLIHLPKMLENLKITPAFYGILTSLIFFVIFSILIPDSKESTKRVYKEFFREEPV